MAALLCPGDHTMALRDWVLEHNHDLERIVFYLHARTEARKALKAWHDAGLPIHNTWVIRTWKELHKHFGNHWNNQVYQDFSGRR